MKLIQLNLWQGKLGYQISKFLQAEKPDILCLQEVIDVSKGDGSIFLTVKEILSETGLKNVFFSPVFTFNYFNELANFGNCVITNLAIERAETVFTHDQFIDKLDLPEQGGANMRNFQHAVLRLSKNKILNIINHHGYRIPEHKNGDDKSLEQCQLIARYIQSLTGPTVIAGDFNLVPESESIQQIDKVATNLVAESGIKTTRTNHSPKTEVCDYVFVRDLKVESFRMSDSVVSDHCALVLEFTV
jgi:endonuclease/exonuclease/phosphatase family metal-dependent hydrolase